MPNEESPITFTDTPTNPVAAITANQIPKPTPTPSPVPTPTPVQNIPVTTSVYQSPTPRPWKKIALITALVLAGGSAVGFGAYFYTEYTKYTRPVATESLLSENPNLVLTVTIDTDAEVFTQLENHFKKFPGYSILQKEMSKTGKQQSLSESIQESVGEYQLDFEKEIKPALGSTMTIVIDDLSPLGNTLQQASTVALNNWKEDTTTPDEDMLAFDPSVLANDETVLGASSYKETGAEDFEFPTLDFIAVTPISDFKAVDKVLKKLLQEKKDETVEKKSEGYRYYQFTVPKEDGSEPSPYPTLYGGIIGKNFVVSSSEDQLKAAIHRGSLQSGFASIFRKSIEPSLLNNDNFATVSANLAQEKNTLASAYVQLNFEEFFKDENCTEGKDSCLDFKRYFKHPEDVIYGFKLFTNEDGIGVTSVANRTNLENLSNQPIGTSSAEHVPERVGGLWSDIFTEHTNFNEQYYSFKKNNITDEGLKEWNNVLDEIFKETGFHLERDFVDHIDGPSHFVLLTAKNTKPEGAVVMHVKDATQMRNTLEKTLNSFRDLRIKTLEASIQAMEGYAKSRPALRQSCSSPRACFDPLAFMLTEQKKELETLKVLKLTDTETPAGHIYSFPLPDFSLAFSVENSELILASSPDLVGSVLAISQTGSTEPSLAKNTLYARAQSHAPAEGISHSFVVTQGIINIVSYVVASIAESFATMSAGPGVTSPASTASTASVMDELDGVTAFFRTIKFINASDVVDKQFIRSTVFFDIKELPADQKAKGEAFLEEVMRSE